MEQIQQLKERYAQLETREQRLLLIATIVIAVFLFMTVIYRPFLSTTIYWPFIDDYISTSQKFPFFALLPPLFFAE